MANGDSTPRAFAWAIGFLLSIFGGFMTLLLWHESRPHVGAATTDDLEKIEQRVHDLERSMLDLAKACGSVR